MPEEPLFRDLKAWPDSPPPATHNEPPLEDRITLAFEDTLAVKGLAARVAEITEAAGRAPEHVSTDDQAGAVGDLLAQAKTVHKAVDSEREILNRPLLNAQRGLKGKADALFAPMDKATAPLREALDAFMAAKDEPVVHGDMGARVGARTDYDFEVTDYAKLPPGIRRHPDVLEAINKVIRSQIRGGARAINGVKIWPAKRAVIR